jgi:hypothetical protein
MYCPTETPRGQASFEETLRQFIRETQRDANLVGDETLQDDKIMQVTQKKTTPKIVIKILAKSKETSSMSCYSRIYLFNFF